MLRLFVGARFQVLFHSAPAVLFAFPSRYFLYRSYSVFSLGGWSPHFPAKFHVLRGTPDLRPFKSFSSTQLSCSSVRFQFTGYDSLSGDRISPAGLPHSGTCESQPACGSSQLFAAFRALLRPNTPGHPPCALFSFTLHRFRLLDYQLLGY